MKRLLVIYSPEHARFADLLEAQAASKNGLFHISRLCSTVSFAEVDRDQRWTDCNFAVVLIEGGKSMPDSVADLVMRLQAKDFPVIGLRSNRSKDLSTVAGLTTILEWTWANVQRIASPKYLP
ncbi:MAG TPA: hypothetical protein VGM77_12340 [Gemmatimonadales bacterium]